MVILVFLLPIYFWWCRRLILLDDYPPIDGMICPHIQLKLCFSSEHFSGVKNINSKRVVLHLTIRAPGPLQSSFSNDIQPSGASVHQNVKQPQERLCHECCNCLVRQEKLFSYHCTIHPQLDRRSSQLFSESCQKSSREINNLRRSR